jgi:alginate O-acetyltransferase complex protein AlgI
MLFNTLDFAVFLPIVFVLYWLVTQNNLKLQNCLLLLASYIFYGWWDWRFLSLIFFSSLVDYFIGIQLLKVEPRRSRKRLLLVSIFVNLGLLGFFKYYNFFVENFVSAFSFFGKQFEISSLNIILPVGISFYTFQTLSYSIDVYHRKIEPSKDMVSFFAFVSFFPQLVAGPIERASNLLPQFNQKRTFDYTKAVDGMRQILWGLFKKIVIADNCAIYANEIFNHSADYSGSTLLLGALFFTFQIYGDFSGYSDIAVGSARLFGFDLMKNFNFPYFSRNMAEFWRRWHISLNTWFRDYLYIPLGGSKGGTLFKIRNIMIVFLVSGLWHGANWTFLAWGFLNALYFIPLMISRKNRNYLDTVAQGRIFPNLKELIGMVSTFGLTVFAWIFFRANHISHAFDYIHSMFDARLFQIPTYYGDKKGLQTLFLILIFMVIEWLGRTQNYAIENIGNQKTTSLRWAMYVLIILSIFVFGNFNQTEFIYFAF